jgi:hypothetical protein
VATAPCGAQRDTDLLISQVDRHVARLRAARGEHDLALAERLAGCLRQLIVDTASSCAADRARVRAAVRYFVLRRAARHDRLPIRTFGADQRVIGEIARQLGRDDVADAATAGPGAPALQAGPRSPGQGLRRRPKAPYRDEQHQ